MVGGVTISDSEAAALQGVTGTLEARLNALESMATPVITLNGGHVFVRKDTAYVEPGVTASALGGTIEVMPSSIIQSPATVDTSVVGSVEITYTVASVSVKRTVTVLDVPRPDHGFEFRNNTGTATIVDTYDSSIDAVMSGEATCSIDAQGNYGLIINTNDPNNRCDFTYWNYGRAAGDTGQITIETYFMVTTGSGYQKLFNAGSHHNGTALFAHNKTLIWRPGKITHSTGGPQKTNVLEYGRWHHVVGTIELTGSSTTHGTARLYVDGELVASRANTKTPNVINQTSYRVDLVGTQAYVRMWDNTALNADQVRWLYNYRETENLVIPT